MRNKRSLAPLSRVLVGAALVASLGASLSGCIAVVAGAAVGGSLATVDRRTIGTQTEDEGIELKAAARLPNVVGDAGHVNVTSYNRKVLLTGEVRDEAMKQAVETEVRNTANVETVINELEIAGASSYTSRASDALITSKVKLSIADKKTVPATAVKVVTERGTTYLMGLVTQREGNIASDVAKGVQGVMRVVKVFEYISEEDLNSLQTKSASQ